jgi:predicted MPP superfamily phosphohydrolase
VTARFRRLKRLLGLFVGGCVLLAAWAGWWEPSSLRVLQECIELRWPYEQPLRVAVLTDLHVGSPFNGLAKLRDIVDRTNRAEPDVILILGDLVMHGVPGGTFVPPEDTAVELSRLHARDGVFGVLGNHDVWLDANRVQRALSSAGIPVLEDRAMRIETRAGILWLVGISDYWTRAHDVSAALANVSDSELPVIAFTHNPDIFPEIPSRVTLTIAGHTHGGQVRLPLLGAPIVPSRYKQRFAAGHIIEEGRRLYVATGTGTSLLPVRFRVPPAIAVLTISGRCPKN